MDTVELDNSAETRRMKINIKNSTWCSLYRCTWNFQRYTDLTAFILGSCSSTLPPHCLYITSNWVMTMNDELKKMWMERAMACP